MSAAEQSTLVRQSSEVPADRVVSLDVLRGLTMAVMIFVNALAEVPGLPWWTYHAPAMVDVMTYVDMVFPCFLFIVGMSLPLSISHRLRRNPSMLSLWLHVIVRAFSLLVLGLILANAEKLDPARVHGMSGSIWALLALIAASLYLNTYPKSTRFPAYSVVLRVLGFAGTAVLFAIFRRTTQDGHVAWIDCSYPEILGLIGISYFAVAILFIPTRRWPWMSTVWLMLLIGLNAFASAHKIDFLDHASLYVWPFGNGAMSAVVMAGVCTSHIFIGTGKRPKPARAIGVGIVFAAALLIAGWLLTPLGISKIRATPTWALCSSGTSVLIFAILFWICDVRKVTKWSFFLRPAGSNALTTYLLPDLWYFLLLSVGVTYLGTHFNSGTPAVIKTSLFTLLMLALAAALTKAKVRLQL